ncbi:MAG: LytTR family transcriptional regulator [Bacteroidales bacterium]|nr:LytTR family transcriptional regulator [Bacteroidales bacterium]
MSEFLIIRNTTEFIRFVLDNVVYISAAGNYSDIHTRDNESRTVTLQLGKIEDDYIEKIASDKKDFVRVGKSLIVNVDYVHVIIPSKGVLILSDNSTFKYTLKADKDVLKDMKKYVEAKWKNEIL